MCYFCFFFVRYVVNNHSYSKRQGIEVNSVLLYDKILEIGISRIYLSFTVRNRMECVRSFKNYHCYCTKKIPSKREIKGKQNSLKKDCFQKRRESIQPINNQKRKGKCSNCGMVGVVCLANLTRQGPHYSLWKSLQVQGALTRDIHGNKTIAIYVLGCDLTRDELRSFPDDEGLGEHEIRLSESQSLSNSIRKIRLIAISNIIR